MPEKRIGEVTARVAENVRTFRTRRGMSTYDLAARLTEVGWPMVQTQVTKIEQAQRKVDVDDLIALSIALGVTPNALLFTAEFSGKSKAEPVLTASLKATPVQTWQWATGEQPLQSQQGTVSAARFRLEAAPHRAVSDG